MGNCTDPKLLFERLIIPIEDLVEDVAGIVEYHGHKSIVHYDLNQFKMNFMPSR